MSAKHTPGPWLPAGRHVVTEDGGVIAYVTEYAKPTPRQLANARLIATSPQLLQTCIEARVYLLGRAGAERQVAELDAVIAQATQGAA